jgi:hypothetical protein
MAVQRKKTPGSGIKKGTPNKTTAELKTAILRVFDQVGGEVYLVTLAKDDLKTFCGLLARLIPTAVELDEVPPRVIRNFTGRKREEDCDQGQLSTYDHNLSEKRT